MTSQLTAIVTCPICSETFGLRSNVVDGLQPINVPPACRDSYRVPCPHCRGVFAAFMEPTETTFDVEPWRVTPPELPAAEPYPWLAFVSSRLPSGDFLSTRIEQREGVPEIAVKP